MEQPGEAVALDISDANQLYSWPPFDFADRVGILPPLPSMSYPLTDLQVTIHWGLGNPDWVT